MRIAQITTMHHPASGGIRTVLGALGAGYADAGHEVVLVVPGPEDRDTAGEAVAVVEVASPPIPTSGGYRWMRASSVRSVLDRLRPDVVEASDKFVAPAAFAWGDDRRHRRVLFSHERLDHVLGSRIPYFVPSRPVVDRLNDRAVRNADHVVVASRYGRREFDRIGVTAEIVRLGVDLHRFRPVRAAPGDGSVSLVSVGRLSAEKRPDLAVETVRRLVSMDVDVDLTMVGSGPLEDELRRRAIGLPVRFTGQVADRDRLADLVGRADAAISPCPGECFGLGALEALACGVPVVVASASGAAELIGPGAGLAVPPGPRALAGAVMEVTGWPVEERQRAARSRAELFPWELTVARMRQVHEDLTAVAR